MKNKAQINTIIAIFSGLILSIFFMGLIAGFFAVFPYHPHPPEKYQSKLHKIQHHQQPARLNLTLLQRKKLTEIHKTWRKQVEQERKTIASKLINLSAKQKRQVGETLLPKQKQQFFELRKKLRGPRRFLPPPSSFYSCDPHLRGIIPNLDILARVSLTIEQEKKLKNIFKNTLTSQKKTCQNFKKIMEALENRKKNAILKILKPQQKKSLPPFARHRFLADLKPFPPHKHHHPCPENRMIHPPNKFHLGHFPQPGLREPRPFFQRHVPSKFHQGGPLPPLPSNDFHHYRPPSPSKINPKYPTK